jgi:hypothetical protein
LYLDQKKRGGVPIPISLPQSLIPLRRVDPIAMEMLVDNVNIKYGSCLCCAFVSPLYPTSPFRSLVAVSYA